MQTKNDVIEGAGYLGKKDTNGGQADSTAVPPNQKKYTVLRN